MRKSRKLALVASACVTMLALAITGTVGVLKVFAFGGLSASITVEQLEPVGDFDTALVDIYTEGGTVPPTLLFEVETDVDLDNSLLPIGVIQQIYKVEMSLNGTLDVLSTPPSLTDADQIVEAVQFDEGIDRGVPTSEIFIEWGGILDLSLSAFQPVTFPLGATLETMAVVRTLVSVETVTEARASASGFSEYDQGTLDVIIFDALEAGVDINDNDKPDDQGLADIEDGILIGTGPSGGQVISVWTDLGGRFRSPSRFFHLNEVGIVLDSAAGAVFVDVAGPSLSAIIAAESAFSIYNQGRLVLSVAGTPTDLLDGHLGVNPLGEFDLTESARAPGDPLPPPVNIFALVNVLLRDSAVNPPEWLAVKDLGVHPSLGQLTIDTEVSGPGVEAFLAALPTGEAFGYTYSTTNSVDPLTSGGQIDLGDEMDWQEVTVTLSATSRATISAGDNTVSLSLPSASVIAGSNAVPPSTTLGGDGGDGGDGGGGSCFIATAAYGTPLAGDINVLRALRDSYLLNNAAGAAFVDTYYRLSPPVADAVANSVLLKAAVRTLLAPVVIVSGFVLAMPGASLLLLLACVALAVSRIRRRMTRV